MYNDFSTGCNPDHLWLPVLEYIVFPQLFAPPPPIFRHPHLTAMIFHFQKLNSHYILLNFNYNPQPSLSANNFTSPKGGV